MSQKGVKECSAGFQPAEGLLQTKNLPSSTCRQDAGATISSQLLSFCPAFCDRNSNSSLQSSTLGSRGKGVKGQRQMPELRTSPRRRKVRKETQRRSCRLEVDLLARD